MLKQWAIKIIANSQQQLLSIIPFVFKDNHINLLPSSKEFTGNNFLLFQYVIISSNRIFDTYFGAWLTPKLFFLDWPLSGNGNIENIFFFWEIC